MEIERKFLVETAPPEVLGAPGRELRQGYLAVDDAAEVRIRDDAGSRTLTVKRGSGLVRAEEAVALSADDFDRLWPLTEDRRIEKTRHELAADGSTLEVDVYAGALAGLVVAEVEFASEADAAAWTPPAWVGAEVTGDKRYANQSLAQRGRPA